MDLCSLETETPEPPGVAATFRHYMRQISGSMEMLQVFKLQSSNIKTMKSKRQPVSMPEHRVKIAYSSHIITLPFTHLFSAQTSCKDYGEQPCNHICQLLQSLWVHSSRANALANVQFAQALFHQSYTFFIPAIQPGIPEGQSC